MDTFDKVYNTVMLVLFLLAAAALAVAFSDYVDARRRAAASEAAYNAAVEVCR